MRGFLSVTNVLKMNVFVSPQNAQSGRDMRERRKNMKKLVLFLGILVFVLSTSLAMARDANVDALVRIWGDVISANKKQEAEFKKIDVPVKIDVEKPKKAKAKK